MNVVVVAADQSMEDFFFAFRSVSIISLYFSSDDGRRLLYMCCFILSLQVRCYSCHVRYNVVVVVDFVAVVFVYLLILDCAME